jgi:cytochrome c oxidase cbb3-type subunit 2
MPFHASLFEGNKPNEDGLALISYLKQLQRERSRTLSETLDRRPIHPSRPGDPTRGEHLYRTYCAGCHGVTGGGDGPTSVFFSDETLPRDLTRGYFRNRSTLDLPTNEDVILTLTHGMPGSGMAGFKDLPIEDRADLAAFILNLSRRPADRKPAAVPEPPRPTAQLWERGRELFQTASCAQCHGGDRRGLQGVDRGFFWTDESGRPVPRSTDLTSGIFKSGSSPSRLYRTLFYGRSGAPMPCYFEMFPDEEDRWALVHYLKSLSK